MARGDEQREQTFALLKLLALGDREIDRGRHIDAHDVYAELAAGVDRGAAGARR